MLFAQTFQFGLVGELVVAIGVKECHVNGFIAMVEVEEDGPEWGDADAASDENVIAPWIVQDEIARRVLRRR